jgi:hypothetical protein
MFLCYLHRGKHRIARKDFPNVAWTQLIVLIIAKKLADQAQKIIARVNDRGSGATSGPVDPRETTR